MNSLVFNISSARYEWKTKAKPAKSRDYITVIYNLMLLTGLKYSQTESNEGSKGISEQGSNDSKMERKRYRSKQIRER